jgi:hypothetical protein
MAAQALPLWGMRGKCVGGMNSVIVSPDGKRVAATASHPQGKRPHMHVCDVTSGERLFSAEG